MDNSIQVHQKELCNKLWAMANALRGNMEASVTMNDGVMPRSEIEGKDNSSEDKSNYKVVQTGDMVYNSMRMWQGANGISPCDGIVSPAYTVLMPKIPINNGYFAALFKSPNLINEFRKNSQGILSKEAASSGGDSAFVDALVQMKISEIRELVDSMTEAELSFMMDGVEMNERLAAYSIDHSCGVGIADTLRKMGNGDLLADDLMYRIQLKVAAAAENRLDGCPYPTMSSSGAGTKGLVVILPISETAKAVHASREMTVKALAFGHCVNRYINAYIGKLAPMCSCAMSSSTAACAAMTWLLGGSDVQIGYAIRNITGAITGMICDGGKVGCALKVATSSAAALLCALTAVNNAVLRASDGVCAETPEECIRNIARIGNPGMLQTDREILNIMLEKQN